MTISEIAKLAGVSSAAVSRYFNNGYISEEKREAIKKVVEETGYRPSAQAAMLRTKKTRMIAFIIPKINSNSMSQVVAGLISVVEEQGYQVLLANTQNNPEKEIEYLNAFKDKQVDGVILAASVITPRHKKAMKELTVPIVVVGQQVKGYFCVYHDDYHAMYEMTRLVLRKNRKKVGYIGALEADKAVGENRYKAFCDAVTVGGHPQWHGNYAVADFNIESGYETALKLWKEKGPFDALICATDQISIGVLKAVQSLGIKVPEECMITGQGDSTISKVTSPAITTIHYAYEESGIMAGRLLMDLINGDMDNMYGAKEILMGYSVIERESTGAHDSLPTWMTGKSAAHMNATDPD